MAALHFGGEGESSSESILKPIENTMSFTSCCLPSDELGPGWRKRKRPPTLVIPLLPEEPLVEVEEAEMDSGVVSGGSGWGAFCKKGRRKRHMEDFYKADPGKRFFCIFDGHGGKAAATYAAENLHKNIAATLEEYQTLGLGKEDALKAAFLKTDGDFLKKGTDSGSCCVMAMLGKEDIAISHLGDCRAVMCRSGLAEALTIDHSAKNVDEQKKVEAKGGFVEDRCGISRVQGTLAVTRSFGDGHMKEYISAEPDTILLPWSSELDFLVLASDGLWDKVGNQEVVDAVLHHRNVVYSQNRKPAQDRWKEKKNLVCEDGKNQKKQDEMSKDGKEQIWSCEWKPKELKGLRFGAEKVIPDTISINRRRMKGRNMSKIKSHTPNPNEDKDCKFACENKNPSLKKRRIAILRENQQDDIESLGSDRFKASNIIPHYQSSSSIWGGGACEKVASIALDRGGEDDITVIVIDLKHFLPN